MIEFKVSDEVRIISDNLQNKSNFSDMKVGETFIIKEIYQDTYLRSIKGTYTGVHKDLCELVEEDIVDYMDLFINSMEMIVLLLSENNKTKIKELKDKPKEKGMYSFKDTKINFRKLCIDALEDDIPAFIVHSEDKTYVGLIQSGKSIGVPMVIDDFQKSGNILNFIPDLPYGIFEISEDKIYSWRIKLNQYSKDYKEFRSELDKSIKNRNRKKCIPRKDLIDFKVQQF